MRKDAVQCTQKPVAAREYGLSAQMLAVAEDFHAIWRCGVLIILPRIVFRASIIDCSPLKCTYALRSTSCGTAGPRYLPGNLILAKAEDIQLTEIKMHHLMRNAAVGSYSRLTIIARWRIYTGCRALLASVQASAAGNGAHVCDHLLQLRQIDNAVAFNIKRVREVSRPLNHAHATSLFSNGYIPAADG